MWTQASQKDAGSMKASALAVAGLEHHANEIEFRDRLIVALDVPNKESAFELVNKLGDSVRFYKIGLQLQFAGGLQVASELVARGKRYFWIPRSTTSMKL